MKATLKNTHDYITVTVKDGTHYRMNLTIGRSGHKISGNALLLPCGKTAWKNFSTLVEMKGTTYGDTMKRVQEVAEKATDFETFAQALGGK